MSRKIDALVAEHVMTDGYSYEGPRFSPSTEIADAWHVVEKLRTDFRVDVCDLRTRWQVFVYFLDKRFSAAADTAPMAICLAALKAKGVEVPQ